MTTLALPTGAIHAATDLLRLAATASSAVVMVSLAAVTVSPAADMVDPSLAADMVVAMAVATASHTRRRRRATRAPSLAALQLALLVVLC